MPLLICPAIYLTYELLVIGLVKWVSDNRVSTAFHSVNAHLEIQVGINMKKINYANVSNLSNLTLTVTRKMMFFQLKLIKKEKIFQTIY